MPSPRWRKVLRDLWLHKARTFLVVLAITVGIVGAGSVLDTWSLLRRVTRDEYRQSNPASATLRTESVDGALLFRVRAVSGVRQAEARRVLVGGAQVDGAWRTAMLFVRDDFRTVAIGALSPESGVWPPQDGGIVVESSSLELSAAEVGGTLTLQLGSSPARALPVSGVARDVGLAPGWMEHMVYGFVTPATAAVLGGPASLDELQIVVGAGRDDRDAVRRVAFAVKAAVEATGRPVYTVDVPVPGRHVHAGQIDSLLFTQGAFGVLLLLLSALLVVNLVSAMLAGQVREIGVMQAIGGRPRQIAAMYLALAAALGLVACAVGIPAAAAIGRAYARFTADMLNFDLAGATIPARAVLLQLAVGALLPVLAAAVPVARASRMTVAAALRDVGITQKVGTAPKVGIAPHARTGAGGTTLERWVLERWVLERLGGVGRQLLLSLRNAFRRRQRMALTLVTLATGGAVYLGALNLRAAIVGSVDLIFASQHFDLSLRLARPQPLEAFDGLEAMVGVPGVARAEAWARARAALERPDGLLGNGFTITSPPVPSQLLTVPVEGGRWLLPEDGNALVVNRRLVDDEPGLALGREVTLRLEGRQSRWRVVGVVDGGPTAGAYARREAVARALGGNVGATVVVDAAASDAAGHAELLGRIRDALADRGLEVSSATLVTQQRKVFEDHLLMVASFLGIMGQLMIVVGGLGLASTMSLAVLERTREIGVLRALGARHGAIVAMVQIEALVVALLAWAVAVPLSLPMSVALGRAFARIMLPVPLILVPEAAGVLRWLVVAVFVSLLASAWPAWRATRVATRVALAYE